MVKIGGRVRLVTIPDELPPDDEAGRLEVSEMNGQPAYMDQARFEPSCLLVVT
ncbi:hypothetical protein [Anderseniella sp. Alg231-50]|uniref:hypothetical protein n=1 Tax=Anderseniella sp. Alg231-50 TaxID=1922226 RepID=UPI00307B716D